MQRDQGSLTGTALVVGADGGTRQPAGAATSRFILCQIGGFHEWIYPTEQRRDCKFCGLGQSLVEPKEKTGPRQKSWVWGHA